MMIYKAEAGKPVSPLCLPTLFYAVPSHQDIFFQDIWLNHKVCKFNQFKACIGGDAFLKIIQISSQKA